MLKLSSSLYNVPIFSLRTGGQIGVAIRPLINPNNLKIEGWYALSSYEQGTLFLPTSEIRELSRIGFAVNDQDAITEASEIVRIVPLFRLNFQLEGKNVVTESKQKLGKVENYSVDLDSFYIQKLYVTPPMLRAFTKQQLPVSRSQIVEVTDKKIVIASIEATERSYFTAPAQAQ